MIHRIFHQLKHHLQVVLTLTLLLALTRCASYENFRRVTEDLEIPSQVFNSDTNETWIAVMTTVQGQHMDREVANQETGIIKTRWIDNTKEMNFTDSFENSNDIKAARYKLFINISKGYRGKKEVSKVTIYKRQLVEQDFLQGWKEVPSDLLMEKILLYRIGREIDISQQFKKIEKAKEKEVVDKF